MEMSSSMTMLSVGAAVTSWVMKPMEETTSVVPRGTTMENLPSRSVVTPVFWSFGMTYAPMRGCPSASETEPFTVT